MAGDDEDDGAGVVDERAAAAGVFGGGEEAGEVEHDTGVRVVVSVILGEVRVERGVATELRCAAQTLAARGGCSDSS